MIVSGWTRTDGVVGKIGASVLLQELNLQLPSAFMLMVTRISLEGFLR